MVNSCSHVIVCVINGTCTSSLASGWHTSSSCPPPRPSSPVDTSHLWWSPPGCRGNELVSLEPIYIHIYEKNKIKKKNKTEMNKVFKTKIWLKLRLTSFGATGRCVLLSSSLSTCMYLLGSYSRMHQKHTKSAARYFLLILKKDLTHFSSMLSFSFWSGCKEMLFPWFAFAERTWQCKAKKKKKDIS